ncbi:redoxin domain-containing protein [Paenalkalicoccus suaedae]|uniref:Redoxin domain-containing protein n=1 Tax=Paenalkalicoccus suaedae TaxID=2592382 RepID=A0A859FKH5_9BACI|nr:redoxin domain-containing protein [Paenalkalicoccus suaedae]
MNEYVEDIEAMGYRVLGISPADPASHAQYIEANNLGMEILSDINGELGVELGFIDEEAQMITRGFAAVNPNTNAMLVEIDYLVGENSDTILNELEELANE